MAFTYTDFKKSLKGIFGAKRSVVSGDGGGDVDDHVARLAQRTVVYRLSSKLKASTTDGNQHAQTASVSKTQPLAEQAIFVAEEECDLKSIRVAWHRAPTSHASDYFTFIFTKRKSPSWSVTEQVATLAGTVANLGASPVIHGTKAATLATTTSVLDMDPGDVITMRATKTLLGQSTPPCAVAVSVEEK